MLDRNINLVFLNEMGIDHMAAMKIINEVKMAGGEVTSFSSYCGGLPAPENNNNLLLQAEYVFGFEFSVVFDPFC